MNISNRNIPDSTLRFLSLGDNFSLPFDSVDRKDRLLSTLIIYTWIDKNFEFNSHKVSNNVAEKICNNITNSIQKYLRKNKHLNYIDKCILNDFSACRKFLQNNEDVFVSVLVQIKVKLLSLWTKKCTSTKWWFLLMTHLHTGNLVKILVSASLIN